MRPGQPMTLHHGSPQQAVPPRAAHSSRHPAARGAQERALWSKRWRSVAADADAHCRVSARESAAQRCDLAPAAAAQWPTLEPALDVPRAARCAASAAGSSTRSRTASSTCADTCRGGRALLSLQKEALRFIAAAAAQRV